jgi:rhodanese-related sulfurtransferase
LTNDFEVNPAEARALADAGAVLVDVREAEEWAAGYAPESVHIPMAELPEEFDSLPEDRVIVVVCRTGARSARATGFLVQQGYDARNLAGGLVAWTADGFSLVTDAGTPGRVI